MISLETARGPVQIEPDTVDALAAKHRLTPMAIGIELLAMHLWLLRNPRRRPVSVFRFIDHWLAKRLQPKAQARNDAQIRRYANMDNLPGGKMSEVPQAWVERLFARFQAIYGNRMTTMWGDVPPADVKDAWQTGLEGLPVEAIRMGLLNTVKTYLSWPPTLAEFRALCKPDPIPAAQRAWKGLPAPHGGPIPESARLDIARALERAQRGIPRLHGSVDMRTVFASTYVEVAGKVEKVPMP